MRTKLEKRYNISRKPNKRGFDYQWFLDFDPNSHCYALTNHPTGDSLVDSRHGLVSYSKHAYAEMIQHLIRRSDGEFEFAERINSDTRFKDNSGRCWWHGFEIVDSAIQDMAYDAWHDERYASLITDYVNDKCRTVDQFLELLGIQVLRPGGNIRWLANHDAHRLLQSDEHLILSGVVKISSYEKLSKFLKTNVISQLECLHDFQPSA